MADSYLLPRKAQNVTDRYLAAVTVVLQQHWDPKVHALLLERLHRDVWYKYLEKRLPYFTSSPATVLMDFARSMLLAVGGDLLIYHHKDRNSLVPTLVFDADASGPIKTASSEG